MNNSTNSNFSQKPDQQNELETEIRFDKSVKIVKNYLDKLPQYCEKVSSKTLKKVLDFAKAYRVMSSKKSGHVEVNLN